MEISTIPGNPAHSLRNAYGELMTIQDVNLLKVKVLSLIEAPGISDGNRRKFKTAVAKEGRLTRLQSYLTNFILAADGLAVIA